MPGDRRPLEGTLPLAPLPTTLELLFVSTEEPSWTLLTLELDRLGCTVPRFRWCDDLPEAVRLLRHEGFDCIIIDDAMPLPGSPPRRDDLLELLHGLRAGGCDDPILLLTDRVDDGFLKTAGEADCELLITRAGWRSAAAVAWIRRTIDRWKAFRERDLSRSEQELRVSRQSGEGEALLFRRRELANRIDKHQPRSGAPVFQRYSELLRAAIITGSGHLREELERIVDSLRQQRMASPAVLQLHLETVEALLQGLGSHAARHVIERADLLALELLALLGEDRAERESFARPSDSGVDLLRVHGRAG